MHLSPPSHLQPLSISSSNRFLLHCSVRRHSLPFDLSPLKIPSPLARQCLRVQHASDNADSFASYGSAAGRRTSTAKLARLSGGRCLAVNYRLSPQYTFPLALADVLLAYITLLYPGPGCEHSPTLASQIVLAGDSSGANLCFALIRLLRDWISNGVDEALSLNGITVVPQLPAGLAVLSPFTDHTQALPSHLEQRKYDLFGTEVPWAFPDYPSCAIWPARSYRMTVYAEDSALCHPLISPAIESDWVDWPPMFIACGEEQMEDSAKLVVQQAHQAGVPIEFQVYQAMPHVFAQLPGLDRSPQAKRCFHDWANFCSRAVLQPQICGASFARFVPFKQAVEDRHIPFDGLLGPGLSVERCKTLMRNGVNVRRANIARLHQLQSKI